MQRQKEFDNRFAWNGRFANGLVGWAEGIFMVVIVVKSLASSDSNGVDRITGWVKGII
jgi:hypothetical protein